MSKKSKDMSIANKIFEIAEIVEDLNPSNKVKCGVQNNFGHVTIKKIAAGCNVRVHHMFDNCLSLDLLISSSSLERYQNKCRDAKSKFKQLFTDKLTEEKEFIIPSRGKELHYRLWLDITTLNIEEIKDIILDIKSKFA